MQSNVVRRPLGLLLLCFAALFCAACGWHLQGVARLPESTSPVYVDAFDRYSDFTQNLRRRLTSAGARVVENRAEARAVIKVRGEDFGHTVVSVSALNIPQEYQAYYQVQYSVELQGKEVIEPQTLRLSHNFSYDEKAMLAKEVEEDGLRASLSRDLVEQVLRRLATL
jgi:LPS-assembly lipoprotein